MERDGDAVHSGLTMVAYRTLVQPEHREVSTSWRQTCNPEVKTAVSELYREDKTAVKIWVQTQLFPFPIFPRNFSDPALDIFMPFESTFKQNNCLDFIYLFIYFYKVLYK